MASKDKTTVHLRHANLFLGTAGVEAATAVGYKSRDSNVVFTLSRRDGVFHADDEDMPVIIDNKPMGATIAAGLWQVESALMAFALGMDATGQAISPANTSTWNEHSIKIVGALRDGTAFTVKALNAKPTGDFVLNFNPDEPMQIPINYSITAPASGANVTIEIGTGNDDVTLSTGVLTRVINRGYHIVNAESGVADQLDSITAGDLVDNETLRLQAASGDSITLAHLNGTLELWGDANWVMDSVYDYIDLQYDLAGTKWVETQRFDYSSAV